MRTLKVQEVMTREVTTVREDTTYKDVVRALVERGVSGLPVVTPIGIVAGVVSEGDLLFNEGSSGEHDRWRDLLHCAAARKADGRVARELMTSPPVTVSPDTSVRKAAALLARHSFKRLPVVDGVGRLLGIVSRRDVLSAFLRPDADIAHEVEHEMILRSMATDPAQVGVQVVDGVVTLAGQLERKSSVDIAVSLTHAVAGVVDVVDKLTYVHDDEKLRLIDPVPGGVQPRLSG